MVLIHQNMALAQFPTFFVCLILIYIEPGAVLSHFEGVPGDSDVFLNPNCAPARTLSTKKTVLCTNCAKLGAECVQSDCRQCKCRKATRIYRSDVRKCLSDVEARDPWCRYQFLGIGHDDIPTIDLAKPCQNKKRCSQPINAPFDKMKSKCRFSWVQFLQNGTEWHEKPVREFEAIFSLNHFDYFAERGYMYSLQWKTIKDPYIPQRLFQVSLECLHGDSEKESYCLMFRVKGKGQPKVLEAGRMDTRTPRSKTGTTASSIRPTKHNRRRVNTRASKVIVVSDNFAVILAAIAGSLGTALVIIPLAIFFRRNTRRSSSRCVTKECSEHGGFEEEVQQDQGTSEETLSSHLSSYMSLKRNREEDEPPSIYQSLNLASDHEDDLPVEDPIYISVSGDEDDVPSLGPLPEPPPPIYHVLEDLESALNTNTDANMDNTHNDCDGA